MEVPSEIIISLLFHVVPGMTHYYGSPSMAMGIKTHLRKLAGDAVLVACPAEHPANVEKRCQRTRLNNIIDAAYAVVPLPFHDSFIVGKLAGYLGQSFIFTPASDTNIHSSSSLKLAYIVGVRLHHESDLEISIMAYVLIWWQRRAFPDLLFH